MPWTQTTDEQGQVYYYNTETGATAWENPEPTSVLPRGLDRRPSQGPLGLPTTEAGLGGVKAEAPVMTPRNQEPAPEAHGKRLHAGMVERETTVAGSVVYAKRFAVLYSDPILGFFTDESAAEPKGSRSVACATATHDGQVVEIAVPNEKLSIKLRTSTVEEAQVLTWLHTNLTTPTPFHLEPSIHDPPPTPDPDPVPDPDREPSAGVGHQDQPGLLDDSATGAGERQHWRLAAAPLEFGDGAH